MVQLFCDFHGKGVVLIYPHTRGTFADVVIWDCEGAQRAKGHFKDCEVGANCIVLLTVLCLWERGTFLPFL